MKRFENIRNLREDNDKLQVELAAYLDVKQRQIAKKIRAYHNGSHRMDMP